MSYKDFKFGIEIESILENDDAESALREALGIDAAYDWRVKKDGSVTEPDSEVVSPPLRYADMGQVFEVARSLRRMGALIDRTCGVHVHVDAEDMQVRHISNLIHMVYRYEDYIYAALGVLGRRERSYAPKMYTTVAPELFKRKPRTRSELNNIPGINRRAGLNLGARACHGTVEFRWFNGSLNPTKLSAYIHFVLCLMDKAQRVGEYRAAETKRPYNEGDARRVMLGFLSNLGMAAPELRPARQYLLSRLPASLNGRD